MPNEFMKSPLEQPWASESEGEELEDADGTLTPTSAIAQHLRGSRVFRKATKYQSRTATQLRYIMKTLLWASSHGYWSADFTWYILDLDEAIQLGATYYLSAGCAVITSPSASSKHATDFNGSWRLMLSILQHHSVYVTLHTRCHGDIYRLYYYRARAVSR